MPALVPMMLLGCRPADILTEARAALLDGSESEVLALFKKPDDASYLLKMAKRRGGLKNVQVVIFPAPPGWDAPERYWAVFHAPQDIEEDHDPIYRVEFEEGRTFLSPELPLAKEEFDAITSSKVEVQVHPGSGRASVVANLTMRGQSGAKPPILRLNDFYTVTSAQIDGRTMPVITADSAQVAAPNAEEVLRAGSLLIPWISRSAKSAKFEYTGKVDIPGSDKISSGACYLTAWWVPTTAQIPHTSVVTMIAPENWRMVSEGVRQKSNVASLPAGMAATTFESALPISFPKAIGGAYSLAASLSRNGRTFSAYHLGGVIDKERAAKDVKSAADVVDFYDEAIGPFPYKSYDIYDSDSYYGIESYSYTLLARSITPWATTHEIGHTYFGGLVPCPYVRDTWNEGVTQYVDSVLFKQNSDHTLENGLKTVNVKVPLDKMFVPWDYEDASYSRGAYVMRMLENEIGLAAMKAAFHLLIAERVGKDTVWADLRQYFERASVTQLGWFWRQWVESDTFPTVEVHQAFATRANGNWKTRVILKQTGTPRPYRLTCMLRIVGDVAMEQAVTFKGESGEFEIESPFEPKTVSINPLGRALIHEGSPFTLAK